MVPWMMTSRMIWEILQHSRALPATARLRFIQKEDSNNTILMSTYGRCDSLQRLELFQLSFQIFHFFLRFFFCLSHFNFEIRSIFCSVFPNFSHYAACFLWGSFNISTIARVRFQLGRSIRHSFSNK